MTAQIHEKIRYKGKRMGLATCPDFPEDHPRIIRLSEEEAFANDPSGMIFSTACWREYIGSWSIRRGKLYLTKLEGRFHLEGKDAIFAEWYSGELRIPGGEILEYVHVGFNSIYEEELILSVEQGVVTDTKTIEFSQKSVHRDLINREINLPE